MAIVVIIDVLINAELSNSNEYGLYHTILVITLESGIMRIDYMPQTLRAEKKWHVLPSYISESVCSCQVRFSVLCALTGIPYPSSRFLHSVL
jgi:hypothetical protein